MNASEISKLSDNELRRKMDNRHFRFVNTTTAQGSTRLDVELDYGIAKDVLIEALKQLTDNDGLSGSTTIYLTLQGVLREVQPLQVKVAQEKKDV